MDELAKMSFGLVHYLYRVGTLCITTGIFLFVVEIFRGGPHFGVIPFRLVLAGFGLVFWDNSLWKNLNRLYAIAFLTASLMPTRFYIMAYEYLK